MSRLMGLPLVIGILTACNPPPEIPDNLGQVGYRTGLDETNSGERGTIKITEIGWAGSVTNDGDWDRRDIFVEVRNESNRQMFLNGWRVIMEGTEYKTWIIEGQEEPIGVGDYLVIGSKPDGCFPNADLYLPTMDFGWGDPFRLTLRDADERLIEPAGSRTAPPYAGIYDGQVVRSMEKAELMFGGRGSDPESWHHYTSAEVDVVNNDLVAENCRTRTLASPGRPNSPDYSGAFSAGATD